MANNNLQNIKLGAPSRIVGGDAPNAELSVQTTMRLRELTMKDGVGKCTKSGSVVSAARLLTKMVDELESDDDTLLKVGFADAASASACWNATDGAAWKSGDEITLSGLKLWIRDSVEEDFVEVPNSDVFWSVGDVIEGEMPTIDEDGTVTAGLFVGNVCCSLKADTSRKAHIGIFMGLGNASSDQQLSGLWNNRAAICDIFMQNPQMAGLVVEYPKLIGSIVENPQLVETIAEWPDVVNSLVDTGKINWLATNGNAYINTNFIPTSDSTVIADLYVTFYGGMGLFGAPTSSSDYGFAVYCAAFVWAHSHNSDVGMGTNIDGYIHLEKCKNILWFDTFKHENTEKTFVCSQPMFIFAGSTRSGSASRIAPAASNLKISKFDIYDNEIMARKLVPFVRNGENGLIDLLSNTFYANQGAGSFSIITETK